MMTAKPYKKRLLSSLHTQVISMEVENSDGTERNHSASPSSQEESEKDAQKEFTRTRKGWKKKVCRKQFRHHDIEIFKPGTNPTNCFLKKKDASPNILKKLDSPIQKEHITDSIVSCLNTLGAKKSPTQNTTGTNNNQTYRATSLTEKVENKNNKTTQPETNKNSSHFNNISGRHNMPAIVSKSSNIRRQSIDVWCGAKINFTAPHLLPGARRLSIDMPLLAENKTSKDKKENTMWENKTIEYNEIVKQVEYTSYLNKQAQILESRKIVDGNEPNISLAETLTRLQGNFQDLVSNAVCANKYSDRIQSHAEIYYDGVELETRKVSEVPIDLSVKTPKNLSLIYQNEVPRKPPIERSLFDKAAQETNNWFLPSAQMISPTCNTQEVLRPPQPINAPNLRKIDEEIHFHLVKMKNILQKDFSTNNLRRLCQNYQHLSKILGEWDMLSLKTRAYIENLLNETFKYMTDKLKHLNLDLQAVLKVLGSPEHTPEKAQCMEYLNKMLHHAANMPIQKLSNEIQQRQKVAKPPRISPKERFTKMRCQKKIEELRHLLPPFSSLPPNYINSVKIPQHTVKDTMPSKLEITLRNRVPSQWRYNSEILTPSPTSPNVTFPAPSLYESNLNQRLHSFEQPMSLGTTNEAPFQSSNRPNSLPNMNNLALNESPVPIPERPKVLISPVNNSPLPPRINSEIRLSANGEKRPEFTKEMNANNRKYLDANNKVKTIKLGSVIVADTSMQITKEPVRNSKSSISKTDHLRNNKDNINKEPEKMDTAPTPESGKNKTEIEFLNIIQKLKSEYPEEKMTELLLSQLQGAAKKRKIVVENSEPIEITDSDGEDSRKEVSKLGNKMFINISNRQTKPQTRKTETLEITTKTKLDIKTKIRIENKDTQNYTPTSVQYTVQKTIYSPEIEPISPVEEEQTHVFKFPEVSNTINSVKESNKKNIKEDKKQEYKSDIPKFKRRKSDDLNTRIAPHGKLCYIKEKHLFLRYFAESQAKLFVENSVGTSEESIVDKTILNQNTPPSEKIYIPPVVEFSHKGDIPEPIEFVHELRLVEQYVPKDFAAFYRFVTGYQIVRNKNPVSLETFLLMYNTDGLNELLKKYLDTNEGDQMVPM